MTQVIKKALPASIQPTTVVDASSRDAVTKLNENVLSIKSQLETVQTATVELQKRPISVSGGGGGGGTPSEYLKRASVSGSTLTLTNQSDQHIVFSGGAPSEYVKSASKQNNGKTLRVINKNNTITDFTPVSVTKQYTGGTAVASITLGDDTPIVIEAPTSGGGGGGSTVVVDESTTYVGQANVAKITVNGTEHDLYAPNPKTLTVTNEYTPQTGVKIATFHYGDSDMDVYGPVGQSPSPPSMQGGVYNTTLSFYDTCATNSTYPFLTNLVDVSSAHTLGCIATLFNGLSSSKNFTYDSAYSPIRLSPYWSGVRSDVLFYSASVQRFKLIDTLSANGGLMFSTFYADSYDAYCFNSMSIIGGGFDETIPLSYFVDDTTKQYVLYAYFQNNKSSGNMSFSFQGSSYVAEYETVHPFYAPVTGNDEINIAIPSSSVSFKVDLSIRSVDPEITQSRNTVNTFFVHNRAFTVPLVIPMTSVVRATGKTYDVTVRFHNTYTTAYTCYFNETSVSVSRKSYENITKNISGSGFIAIETPNANIDFWVIIREHFDEEED